MFRSPAAVAAAALVSLLAAPTARAQLSAFETEDLRILYFEGTESYLVPHVAQSFRNSMAFHRRLFGYDPWEKVTLLLVDLSDEGNAGASSSPRNVVTVQIAPMDFAYETTLLVERMTFLMNHELAHVAAMDQPGGGERFFRRLFAGKVQPIAEQPETILYAWLTTPRLLAPRWYHEGLAVFLDTWMDGGVGRAQGGFDEMAFRAMVKDEARFYDPLGLVAEGTKVQFHAQASAYLYGTRFMTYLAHRYSPQDVIRWVARGPGSKAHYAAQFRQVFGRPLGEAWREWIAFERDFQRSNLEAIRRYPTTPYADLSRRALGSVSRAFVDAKRGKLYAAFNYPGVVAHLGAVSLEDGSLERILDVKGPVMYTVASLAYDPASGTLFYTTDNGAHRDLRSVDPGTRRARTLLKDARIGYLAFNPADRSLWGVRHFNGICTLVRVPHPYREWNKVVSWPYGEVVYDVDVSPDGRRLSASVADLAGRHSLKVMETEALLRGDATATSSFDFGTAIPLNFVFSADGAHLYGSSYYTGVSNVFRYELASGRLEAVSNAETGFFRPVPLGGDELVVFRFSGEGFVPARITARPLEDVSAITFLGERLAEAQPLVKQWRVEPVPLDAGKARTQPYRLAGSLGLESLYPVVQGYKDSAAVGLRLNLSDPILLNRASVVASYTPGGGLPENERFHLAAEYERYDWRARFRLNGADFYDLFGPTKTGRKGYAASLGWKRTLVYDEPRTLELDAQGTWAGNLDRLPDFQEIAVDVDRLFSLRARLSFSDVRSSLGHVDDEKGIKWELALEGEHVEGRSYPRFRGGLDLGLALPIPHSSFWLRGAAGFSPGDREQPFANFYFGGFGNNWVDHREEKRYREHYSLPGLELNEVGGRNFGRALAEWNLPPVRFRRAGSPGFHLTWARPALFAGVLVTDLDDRALRRVVSDAGAQLDLRLVALDSIELTLSLGYAAAFEEGLRPRREAMVSLKLGK
jgi:hypothetical protein